MGWSGYLGGRSVQLRVDPYPHNLRGVFLVWRPATAGRRLTPAGAPAWSFGYHIGLASRLHTACKRRSNPYDQQRIRLLGG